MGDNYFPFPPAPADEQRCGGDEAGGRGRHGDHEEQGQVEVGPRGEEDAPDIVLQRGSPSSGEVSGPV